MNPSKPRRRTRFGLIRIRSRRSFGASMWPRIRSRTSAWAISIADRSSSTRARASPRAVLRAKSGAAVPPGRGVAPPDGGFGGHHDAVRLLARQPRGLLKQARHAELSGQPVNGVGDLRRRSGSRRGARGQQRFTVMRGRRVALAAASFEGSEPAVAFTPAASLGGSQGRRARTSPSSCRSSGYIPATSPAAMARSPIASIPDSR